METPREFAGDWLPEGFEVTKIRRPRKDAPDWVMSRGALRSLVIKEFRRVRVAYLFWRCGWSEREVAEETGIGIFDVRNIIAAFKKHPPSNS